MRTRKKKKKKKRDKNFASNASYYFLQQKKRRGRKKGSMKNKTKSKRIRKSRQPVFYLIKSRFAYPCLRLNIPI